MVSGRRTRTTLDLSEMRLRGMSGLVNAAAARLARSWSRSWRFLRRVSGTSWRALEGSLAMVENRSAFRLIW